MKKCCIYCNAELDENQERCGYCGRVQDPNQFVGPINEQYNPNQEFNNYNYQNEIKKNNIMKILLIISIVACMVSCFLPYFTILGYSQNYVYTDSKILDGVFVIAFGAAGILSVALNKRVLPLIFQSLSLIVFLYDYFNQKSSEYSQVLSHFYGIGFYFVFIFLIISVSLAIVRIIKKEKYN